jgi:hypothetical protein
MITMDMKLVGYAVAAGIGFALGYVVFSKPAGAVSVPPSVSPSPVATDSRWTTGYHGPINNIYPEAGVAEMLYPYGQYHKMTSYSEYSTYGSSKNGANGSVVYID